MERIKRSFLKAGLGLVFWTLGMLPGMSLAQDACGTCGFCCQRFHCPPRHHHCQERPPCIKIHCGCPKPICTPCNMPNWGYYQTCWAPWPWPPDWSHCPTIPPAAMVMPGPVMGNRNPEQAPSPRIMPPMPMDAVPIPSPR